MNSAWELAGVRGSVAPGFEPVAEALRRNLGTADYLGGQVAVVHEGSLVVDLHGGSTYEGMPYPSDALHPLWSVTKAVMGVCFANLVAEGLIDLSERVGHYWPRFAVAPGQGETTVSQLLAHQAGLPAWETPPPPDRFGDWDGLLAELLSQEPAWRPGREHGYHALTIGYLAGTLFRAVSGMSVGAYLRERCAGPSGMDVWIGLPAGQRSRVVSTAPPWSVPDQLGDYARQAQLPASLPSLAFASIEPQLFNDRSLLDFELPSANGVSDARSLARLMATMVDGPQRRVPQDAVAAVTTPVTTGFDRVLLGQRTRFGALFFASTPDEPMLGPGCFGHNGFGGAVVFADPSTATTFAYLGNRPNVTSTPHARVTRLIEALRVSLLG